MKKLTRGQSCVLCQQRKVRCDQQKPCINCVRAQAECTVMPLVPPKPRRKKTQQHPQSLALVERLHLCETLLAQSGVDVDRELRACAAGTASIATTPRRSSRTPSSHGPARSVASAAAAGPPPTDIASTAPGVKWFAYHKEYQATDELLRGSSSDHTNINNNINNNDDQADQPAIHRDFDAMFDDSDAFPFVVGGGGIGNISSLHPPVIEILQLWQVYIQRVDVLLKITHLPTLQAQIVSAGANPTAVPKPLEAFMFAMYLIAVHSMTDNEVQDMFHGESKPRLLARYRHATQQALINAAFMRTTELTVLQAYLLYLFSVNRSVDPRSLFCLVGIAIRIGIRLGLHRDCARFGMSPFETELRRRLWWQTVMFDARLAEMTGSPITALTSCPNQDCCLPLNVNDTDLHPSAKEPPTPAVGATEMLFSLTRIELAIAATTNTAQSGDGPFNRPGGQSTTAAAAPLTTSHQSSMSPCFSCQSSQGRDESSRRRSRNRADSDAAPPQQRLPPDDLEAYCAHFDAMYLQHCEPAVPIQHFTLLMARGALCKQRIMSFMCRRVPSSTLSPQERDTLFLAAIQMVEYDTLICATSSLRGFRWYADLHAPMIGSLFLASELRLRTSGELCDRAWKAIFENQEQRGSGGPPADKEAKRRGSPMHAAFEDMLLKAWEAREQAELQSGGCSNSSQRRETPPLIARSRKASRANHPAAAMSEEAGTEKPPGVDDCQQAENDGADHNNNLLMMGGPAMMGAQLTPMTLPPMFDDRDLGSMASLHEYNDLDWTYLVQSGALQGFMDGPNGMYMG